MARQPFYGRGPGPAIARMDMNAATAPGRLYGQMFANLGKIAGDSIEKYAEGKKKKEEQKQTASFIKRALINSPEIAAQFGIQGDDSMTFEEAVDQGSNAIAKDPKGFEMVKGFAAMADQQRKAQQDTELFNRKISQFDQSQETADELKQAKGDFLGKFYSSVPTGELNEAGQEEVANFQAFAAPEDPRTNPFIQETLQNPEFQQTEPVMDMTGNRFAQQFAGDSPEVQQLALNFMQARQKDAPSISRVGNELNPKTGEYEQIARDKFGNPIANYGPPKPSGMYPTPEDARRQEILVGRTKDAMAFNKEARNNSNIAISQAEQAQQALKYLPETTGGLTSFVNEMKVIGESLGIDLPEGYQKDMADIGAFRQLTGQFLFEAMSNTKGAITEREMKLFRQISPDIDNSRAANKLMLEIYVKAGDRAKQRRDLIRDLQKEDVDPRQIQIAIEDYDDANSLMDDIRSLPRKTNQNSQAQPNRTGVRGGSPPPNSNAQTPGGFKIQTR